MSHSTSLGWKHIVGKARRNDIDIGGGGAASDARFFSGPRPSDCCKTPVLHKLHQANDEKMQYLDV